MEADERTHRLLEEIRDAQREHFAEYRACDRPIPVSVMRAMQSRTLGLVLIAIVAAGSGGCYSPAVYRGAGPLIDTGFWSFPRYHAPVGEFPLAQSGEYVFTFSALPNEKLSLQLYVEPFAEKTDRDVLAALTTKIAVRIEDSTGAVICEASGSPSERRNGGWALMSASDRGAYWHSGCLERRFVNGRAYTLRVAISEPDANAPRRSLLARLEGGGTELP